MNLIEHALYALNETVVRSTNVTGRSSTTTVSPKVFEEGVILEGSGENLDLDSDYISARTVYNSNNNSFHETTVAANTSLFFAIYGVVILIVGLIGVFGNVAALAIFTRPQMRGSINVYLAALSVFDAVLLLMVLLIYPAVAYCSVSGSTGSIACAFVTSSLFCTYPLSLVAQTSGVWLCVAAVIDRFIAICVPLRAHRLCSTVRAQLVSAFVALFAVIYNVPAFFELPATSPNGLIVGSLKLGRSELYRVVYKTYAYLFAMILLPVVIMIGINIPIVRAIVKTSSKREEVSVRQEKERKATTMVTVMILTFVLLNFIAFWSNFLEAFSPESSKHRLTWLLVPIANLMIALNAAVRFPTYCVFGVRFRQTCIKLFCPFWHDARKDFVYESVRSEGGSFRRNTPARETYGIISMKKIPPPTTAAGTLQSTHIHDAAPGKQTALARAGNRFGAPRSSDADQSAKPVLTLTDSTVTDAAQREAEYGPRQKTRTLPFDFGPFARQSQAKKLLDDHADQ